MFEALIAISIYLSFIDIQKHLITNRALVLAGYIFLSISAATNSPVNPFTGLIVVLLAPVILKFGIGAGDIKLLVVLSIFFIPLSWQFVARFLLAFSLISSAFLAQQLVKSRSLAGSLALAPAICGAVIWCAR